MCTIMTVDRPTFYTDAKIEEEFRERIWRDSISNRDGQSVILVADNEIVAQLRSMDANLILGLIDSADWDRIFVHSRLATQGEVSLANTHGWNTEGIYYMHNGFISASEANLYEVDSQAIGHWIRRGGIDNALAKLKQENYANVLMIDPEDWSYYMHRSRSGSLYTDGNGNYSTNQVGPIRDRVKDCTQEVYALPIRKAAQAAPTTPPPPPPATDHVARVAGDPPPVVSPTSEASTTTRSPTAEADDELDPWSMANWENYY